MPFKAISSLAGVLAGLLAGGPAMAEELVILTSFPPNFYEVLIQKFEQAHSDIKVEIVQRSTTSGVRFLLERVNADVDVFWASSPDAFELLKDRDQLAVVDVAIPLRDGVVAGYPVNDADGRYFGFAFSTFGAAYNPTI
ncbi:MAG: extracellular solute-binding protein [Devosia sp.]|uniref:extracellular solute-binding protein n=1 Tax=Devosia sp. TaxID=1871048 RepID=UPI001A38ABFC|nr:extracellular solute-binding protein [Devosia sp.]MBL8598602.1 extracellular solute-binding protein [Devosia sp.]